MNNAIKVGVFMFVVLVIAGVFIIKIEDMPISRKGFKRITVVFPDVAGLDEKSAVRIAGVRVGKVDSIRLLGDHAEVVLLIDGQLALSQGASAAVRNMGLLGDKYVELFPGDSSHGLLPDEEVLKGHSPVSYDRILELITSIGEDVKQLSASLSSTFGGAAGADRLDRIVQNVEDFTHEIKTLIAENRSAVSASTGNIEATTADIRRQIPAILEGVQELVGQLNTLIADNRSNVDGTMVQVKEASTRLNASLGSLSNILEGLERGEGTVGKLLKEDTTHDTLVSALNSVKGGADSLQDSLGRIKKWKLDLGFRGEYLSDIEESRTAFGLKLSPGSNRFYMLEVVDDPDGKRSIKDETVTTTLDDGTILTETTRKVKYDDTYTWTAMLGWSLDRFQLRGGIIQSTGGVGVDYMPITDKLTLTMEAFDFSREDDTSFHLRLLSRYYFHPNLYVLAGWDDMLSDNRDSIFFGGGMSWSDEDFKYLIGSGVRP
ncbi:MAG TPA: MlaD family protein [Thermoanaerobaculia bacterium]|nr:MlaD family protein [Thermoanaerobaculia bacterium]HUM28861.1 MlaD family protein [Thermoanaerobaculia bacterium]HXK67205.1 MlaD family protein [Thermoanaerobaculia bacterium]